MTTVGASVFVTKLFLKDFFIHVLPLPNAAHMSVTYVQDFGSLRMYAVCYRNGLFSKQNNTAKRGRQVLEKSKTKISIFQIPQHIKLSNVTRSSMHACENTVVFSDVTRFTMLTCEKILFVVFFLILLNANSHSHSQSVRNIWA